MEDRVGEDQLAPVCPDVELDHVNADLKGGVERGQRVSRSDRACPAVSNPLAAMEVDGASPG
jgi:hypothetical protein